MGKVVLNNIRVYAYHGCLQEEGAIGSDYRVDLTILANLRKPSQTDQLSDTVDYVHLNKIVKDEMALRSKLLEHVAQRICDRIFAEIGKVNAIEVSVSKVNPPIGGDVELVTVTLSRERS